MQQRNHFPEVTLLVTTYNRSKSLQRLLSTFKSLEVSFGDVVVSDDGSKPQHLAGIKALQSDFNFRLEAAEKNQGLGANINKGQQAVTTPYTLYVQEDFEPLAGFLEHFTDALSYMNTDSSLDLIRFYAYFKYPYTKPYGKGFSEMLFSASPFANNHIKFYVYSDHPHLRRSSFLQKFGKYNTSVGSDEGEARMALSFIKNGGKGLVFDQFNTVFEQVNTSDEPSTMERQNWRESRNPFFLAVRAIYLQAKLLSWTYKLLRTRKSG
ncbi:Glycosyltransferase involved in cell wall bisynthesis [Pedobacter westerhofensis]|uniref:Glycosyltransferase involved in cell wall bisynthesis n=1 Tax=Pedobacter westerhofensis TaxID=425512 RepID=A0A521E6E1_9SPHI|nr:glycosyltransferase [Pedobacter westerhofensis]SMO79503.1 Glycosyltransferase involved in cell wall bisynthesis [Pedobacter westerhofensis]